MNTPPRGKQPQNRLNKEENERIIHETLRRVRLEFPTLFGNELSAAIIAGTGPLGTPLLTDDGTVMVDDSGNIIYVG